MGRCHLRCKNRTLLLCSVSLLRVGDKFRVFYWIHVFYFIYFMLLLVLLYCPKLGQKFFTKWCYSPDINSFRFCSALNPDRSIRMNRRYSPWFFSPNGLCFAEYTVLTDEYFVTDFVIVVNTFAIFTFVTAISLVLPIVSNFVPVSYERNVEEHVSSEYSCTWWGF